MGAAVSGPDPARLLAAVYRKLLTVPAKISARGAAGITKRWRAAYLAGRSPDGQTWAPLAASTVRRKGSTAILRRTDGTLDQTRAVPSPGAGIRLLTGPLARYHMLAYKTRPARRVLPRRMPADWLTLLGKLADEENRKATR